MKMLRLLLAPVFALALALPAAAEKIPLSEISRYFNGLTTAESAFTQMNADGSQSAGRVYISRPGRMRFEYAPPDKSLVLASSGQVAIFDGKSNQRAQQYPLSRTPLGIILAPQVDLGRARMVVDHQSVGAETVVVARDPDNPDYGTLSLYFSASPVTLRRWVVTDETGNRTEVRLGPLSTGRSFPAGFFDIERQLERGGR